MKLVAADIGGTSSRFALVSDTNTPADTVENATVLRYRSQDWPDFNTLYRRFLADLDILEQHVDLLLLALPGVIHGRHARLTNLPWRLDSRQMCADFSISRVAFINDFQAAAYGVEKLSPEDTIRLTLAERQADRPVVITGAGTGLGMAYQVPGAAPMVTEGGHVDFAPIDREQLRLLDHLRKLYPDHVSYERILSGDGIVMLYRFLAAEEADMELTAKGISDNAKIGHYDPCSRAIRLFTRILAAFLGNLAMSFQPFGGLYIAGGIAPKIHEWLKTEEFMEYYSAKGRMSGLVSGIPLFLIMNENLGLQGALARARKLIEAA